MRLSVVIAASNNASLLMQCLSSVEKQIDAHGAEVIVASNYDEEVQDMIRRRFPQVKYLACPPGKTVPELRVEGIAHAAGDIIALAEDHCIFDEDWVAEIMKAHERSCPVVGGPVENTISQDCLAWAVYFVEYGKYMLPLKGGVVDSLSGNNVSYKWSLLEQTKDCLRDGFFETFFHRELRRRDYLLYLTPTAIVYHNKNYEIKNVLGQFYHHGRSFAGIRVSRVAALKRFSFIVGSLILPVLIPLRIVASVMRK